MEQENPAHGRLDPNRYFPIPRKKLTSAPATRTASQTINTDQESRKGRTFVPAMTIASSTTDTATETRYQIPGPDRWVKVVKASLDLTGKILILIKED